MYIVNVYIGRSAIQGVGVFAGEDIAAGTVLSHHIPDFDLDFDPAILQSEEFPAAAREFLESHSFLNSGRLWMPGDLDMYTNHSFTPNVGYRAAGHTFYALRDIKRGEEITNDYRTFSDYSRDNPTELS
jgi:SET domain-containing protein